MARHPPAGLLLIALSGVFYAASNATAKLAMRAGAPVFCVTAGRGLVMTLIAVSNMIVMRARGKHPLPVRHWLGSTCSQRGWLVLRGCCGATTVLLSLASLEHLSVGDANALTFTWPLFSVAFASCLLGERLRAVEAVGLVGAVGGSVVVARPPVIFGGADADAPSALGVALALASAVGVALTVCLIRKLVSAIRIHWTVVLLYQTIAQSVLSPLAMLALGQRAVLNPTIAVHVVLTGLLAAVHQTALTIGLGAERIGPAAAVQSTFVLASFILQPLLTPEDTVHGLSVAGAGVITASVVLVLTHMAPPAAECATAASSTRPSMPSRLRLGARSGPRAGRDGALMAACNGAPSSSDGRCERVPAPRAGSGGAEVPFSEPNDAARQAKAAGERGNACCLMKL